MNPRLRDLLIPTLAICVVLPTAAGAWWRYFYNFKAPGLASLTGDVYTGRLETEDAERSYSIYVPAEITQPAAVLVAFQGEGDSQQLRAFTGYKLDQLADQHGFLVVYPDRLGGRWNDCRRRLGGGGNEVDDVGFVRELVKEVREQYETTGPVYLIGYSGGGQMVYRMALEAPETFTAAATVAANLPVEAESACEPSQAPVSIAIVNGTEDKISPFDGGSVGTFLTGTLGHVQSTGASAQYFAQLAGLQEKPQVERLRERDGDPATWVERAVWNGSEGASVALLTVHGGGHTIPQPHVKHPRALGPTSADIDASEEIWRFFTRCPRRGV